MVKHTQIIRRKNSTNFLSVFDHFVGLTLIGLNKTCFEVNSQKSKKIPMMKSFLVKLQALRDLVTGIFTGIYRTFQDSSPQRPV